MGHDDQIGFAYRAPSGHDRMKPKVQKIPVHVNEFGGCSRVICQEAVQADGKHRANFLLGSLRADSGAVGIDQHAVEAAQPFLADVPVLVHAHSGIEAVNAGKITIFRHFQNKFSGCGNIGFGLG